MSTQTFDAIVAGVGGMGAQTCLRLAEKGIRVLGLERFDIPHNMGSSHGVNRIIRLAYFEHPSYVPLLRRAYELWRDLERRAGEQLLYTTGSLDIGPSGSAVVENSCASCRLHDLAHEVLSASEVTRRYPGYALPPNYEAVLQPDGGFVASERAIVAAVNLAMERGAVIRAREPLIDYTPLPGGGVRVRTTRATYEAGRLVLTSGGWIGEHVAHLQTNAIPERQVLGWFQPKRPEDFRLGAFPVSNLKCDLGHFYQFPVWHVPGFKIGLYHHLRETGTADAISREPTPTDESILREGLARFFPAANGDCLALRACLFTNTPDEHFVIDTLPGFPEVIVASPCSGHGYKFASVVGEILANLAVAETPPFDLSLFAIGRFSAPA
jgi:sarcosine oxidase